MPHVDEDESIFKLEVDSRKKLEHVPRISQCSAAISGKIQSFDVKLGYEINSLHYNTLSILACTIWNQFDAINANAQKFDPIHTEKFILSITY